MFNVLFASPNQPPGRLEFGVWSSAFGVWRFVLVPKREKAGRLGGTGLDCIDGRSLSVFFSFLGGRCEHLVRSSDFLVFVWGREGIGLGHKEREGETA